MSTPRDLNTLARECTQIRAASGFVTPTSITEVNDVLAKLMLVTTEVAEAAEAVRVQDEAGFAEELADIVIRVLDLAGAMALDLQDAVDAKMAKNRTRGYRHGKSA